MSRGGKPQKITDNARPYGGGGEEEQEILGVLSRRKREIFFFLFDIISICLRGEKGPFQFLKIKT